jgi:hypothetical protein
MLFEDSINGGLFLFGVVVGAAMMCLLLQQIDYSRKCSEKGCNCKG